MKILFYIIVGIFVFLGVGTLSFAAHTKFKKPFLLLTGFCYLSGAVIAYLSSSWWTFAISFFSAFLAGYFFGDSSDGSTEC